jgi:hypothetical protein
VRCPVLTSSALLLLTSIEEANLERERRRETKTEKKGNKKLNI